MKALRALPLTCVVLLVGLGMVSAQTSTRPTNQSTMTASIAGPHQPKGITISIPVHNLAVTGDARKTEKMFPGLVSSTPIPLWTYNVTAYDGNPYTGQIVGLSPYNHGKTTTTVPLQLVPLVITITDSHGTVTYDPTAADACVPGHTAMDILIGSPVFTNNSYTMNGVNMGSVQYQDANTRAEFWAVEGATPYHLTFQEQTLAGQALSFGTGGTSGPGNNFIPGQTGACEDIGVVDINDMSNAIEALITGPLAGQINVGTFPEFITKNVVMADPGTDLFANCCVLGFHSSFNVGPNLQLWGPTSVDTAGLFGAGYTSTMAHEVGEAVDDPTGTNPTPAWGHQGQQSGCQTNYEVGDPLSPGGIPPTSNEWVSTGSNGITYNMQELAFFSWFYGGASLGSGGLYSNNSTFKGYAKACPPGGTN